MILKTYEAATFFTSLKCQSPRTFLLLIPFLLSDNIGSTFDVFHSWDKSMINLGVVKNVCKNVASVYKKMMAKHFTTFRQFCF